MIQPLPWLVVLSSLVLFGCQDASEQVIAADPQAASTQAEPDPSPAAAESEEPVAEPQAQPPRNESPEAAQDTQEKPKAAGEPAADEPAADEPAADEPAADEPAAGEPAAGDKAAARPPSPYPKRERFQLKMPDLPRNSEWINTRPLRMEDLKGKFVVFDFWTYCCINCIHILPELKKLERKYPNEVVVIGVHSAKFATEKDKKNVAEAVLRYEIEHPVLVDSEHRYWNSVGVSSWPTVLVVDPEGYLVEARPGEIKFEELDSVIQQGLPYYRKHKLLDDSPLHFDLLAYQQKDTPLRFPGKVLADEAGKRLFVTDSNHNRIVISDLRGNVQDIIGSGKIGRADGSYADASFDHPQGLALHGKTLYVSDTENHLLRKVDLAEKKVSTIAGLGSQASNAWPGLEGARFIADLPDRFVGKPMKTGLNSPWALWVHENALYIAMAGPHQIWKMPLDESEIGPYAGNGREDIVDGALMPDRPYGQRDKAGGAVSSFAQPSGLASDGEWLFVADSEGSSIRAVPFDESKTVRTVVGTADLPAGRLFEFGDVDGPKEKARLQHCLGVVYRDGKIYAADTYNNKIKIVDAKAGSVTTFAGNGKPGASDDPPQFDEPAGISLAAGTLYVADTNNHVIRTVDIKSGKVGTIAFKGLKPPRNTAPDKPNLADAKRISAKPQKLKAVDGQINVRVVLNLPIGYKINELAPMRVWTQGASGVLAKDQLGFRDLEKPQAVFDLTLPVTKAGKDELTLHVPYYYCQADGTGLCKAGELLWVLPLEIADDAKANQAELTFEVQ